MGTRGALIFVSGDREVITYNHYDSYPEGLGVDVATFVREIITEGTVDQYAQKALDLEGVGDEDIPTPEQREKYTHLFQNVSTGTGWYSLLRELQGDPRQILDTGVTPVTNRGWVGNSLFCEWAYVINFNTRKVEVYKGFQKDFHTEGRYSAVEVDTDSDYFPVRRVLEVAFDYPDIVGLVTSEDGSPCP
jgi:hypothetical protein